MKMKKVDDKPMVIHTKEKAKIHAHELKGAKIKGSNIYTVERGPKTIGAKVSDDKKKSYRKSTIHQSESGYIPGESEIREAMDRAMIMQFNLLPVARKMVLEELEMKQNG